MDNTTITLDCGTKPGPILVTFVGLSPVVAVQTPEHDAKEFRMAPEEFHSWAKESLNLLLPAEPSGVESDLQVQVRRWLANAEVARESKTSKDLTIRVPMAQVKVLNEEDRNPRVLFGPASLSRADVFLLVLAWLTGPALTKDDPRLKFVNWAKMEFFSEVAQHGEESSWA